MNEFGVLLCERTSAFQNAYSIAADQYQTSNNPSRQQHHPGQRNVQTYHVAGSTSRQEMEPAADNKSDDFCFKCEGTHRLHTSTFFKALPVGKRTTFVIRRGLCLCCYGVRHGARDCREKKACNVGSCKSLHHPLLHDDSAHQEVKSHHAIDTEAGFIAF